jgi:hypothetical protein
MLLPLAALTLFLVQETPPAQQEPDEPDFVSPDFVSMVPS